MSGKRTKNTSLVELIKSVFSNIAYNFKKKYMGTHRKKALMKRRLFLGGCALILILIIVIVALLVDYDSKNPKPKKDLVESSQTEIVKEEPTKPNTNSKTDTDDKVKMVKRGEFELDAKKTNLLLVNADNPLSMSFDGEVRKYLKEIDPKYRNNDYVTKIHESVYPYITAMVANAQKDGVDLKVWSPFRSYADQDVLFTNQVKKVGSEQEAATVVARPGTSEHNSGLCADFNMADDAFEKTPMYKWMCKNAADYGFILRYPKDKQDITGVIYESWHWRFVGIDAAKDIKKSGLCLEEYVKENNCVINIPLENF